VCGRCWVVTELTGNGVLVPGGRALASVPSGDRNPLVTRSRSLTDEDVTYLVCNAVRVPVKSRFKIAPLRRGGECSQLAL
jgi:hypothetical protein